jgi:D-alanine--D-alanine ligase
MTPSLSLALIVGGPSRERGISLNSARSIADHLDGVDISLDRIVYFDTLCESYLVDRSFLYSNTPSDFDFKLSRTQRPLSATALAQQLRAVDLVFPAIHGAFGEDGQLQRILEDLDVPFVGSSSSACERAFDKHKALGLLTAQGLHPVESVWVGAGSALTGRNRSRVASFLERAGSVVVKPCQGGSSIGVTVSTTLAGVDRAVASEGGRGDVLIQPKMQGREFTVVVLDGESGPVALPPLEVELHGGSPQTRVFTHKDKYLPSNDCTYHCPPRFDSETISSVRQLVTHTYIALGLRDFARIDGWVCEDEILISDINPISGMEQNSFFFQQAAEIGLSHSAALRFVVRAACRRTGVPSPSAVDPSTASDDRLTVPIIFGGSTAERQVSVMSGTNVWLKLRKSTRYQPAPYLLRPSGGLWRLPYAAALRHTVEEIEAYCERLPASPAYDALREEVADQLGLPDSARTEATRAELVPITDLLESHKLVFLALHGGEGEDGTVQAMCERAGVRFNGSGSTGSRICMDKYETGLALSNLSHHGIFTARRVRLDVDDLVATDTWAALHEALGDAPYCVKPVGDGCSAGVVPIAMESELGHYAAALKAGRTRISKSMFGILAQGVDDGDDDVVALPTTRPPAVIVEEYIRTDSIEVVDATADKQAHLRWGHDADTGWIEVTVAVLGPKGHLRALSPSITIATNGVLSVEEKFMGGTGVNITPPPTPPLGRVSEDAIVKARERIALVADCLGIEGYARIDAFMHRESGELIVIEANSLPGLTPSTVLYHQALADAPPMFPRDVLELILDVAAE